ncbi:MAG: nucleoside hydrolase [Streptosporangiales bacterium]|nr:nucleoside hydrolase [Streptosporangiales bacterium]
MKTDIILDVDTGVDDALALLFAVRHPELRLLAVSCVAGNAGLDAVVRNTLVTLDAAGAGDVPVAAGATQPLVQPARDARYVHGADGLADLGGAPTERRPVDGTAVELLRRTILGAPNPVTLVLLAPMTNAALLLRTHPEVTANIERVVFMGGSVGHGNATPAAEFNVWHDPEAAAIVLDAGVPTTMYGLDVFYQVAVPVAVAEQLQAATDPGVRLAGGLLLHQASRGGGRDERVPDGGGGLLGDAGAVCAVADPTGLTTRHCPVEVELAPGRSRGQTLVDLRNLPGEREVHGDAGEAATIDVATAVDRDRYRELFLSTVQRPATEVTS